MSEQLLETLEVSLGERCEAAVIWLPHAPHRAVTVNAGMTMRAWFDIRGIGPGFAEDAAGIEESAAAVTALIGRERSRPPSFPYEATKLSVLPQSS